MKKRILPLILALCAVALLATLPITVAASTTGAVAPPSDAITVGDLKIWPTNTGDTLTADTDYTYNATSGVLTVLTTTPLTIANGDITTATSHRIVVQKDISADITLAGVNMESSTASPFAIAANSEGNVTITLADGTTNTLKSTGESNYAALQKEGSGENIGTLTIGGTGALVAEAAGGAGIGSNRSTGADDSAAVSKITITGGTITATSTTGAGLGSGYANSASGDVSDISITGGVVTATSIGSGNTDGSNSGSVSNITITGGSVKVPRIGCQPTDGNGNDVYPCTIYAGNHSLTVNGKAYPSKHTWYDTTTGAWKDETTVCVYSPASLVYIINGAIYVKAYNGTAFEDAKVWLCDSTGTTVKGGYSDLQKAVNVAAAGDVLMLYGVYDDIETAATVEINKDLTLDLFGAVLKMTGNGSALKVTNGAKLTLKDSTPEKAHRFTPNADGLWVRDEADGTQIIYGGVITGGNNTGTRNMFGGGVYIDTNSSLIMSGGNIVGCQVKATYAANGGGVYVGNDGSFTMSGGSIVGCVAISTNSTAFGGGVYMGYVGTFAMSGGKIENCKAGEGGGVYATSQASNFAMSGDAMIENCKATHGGGLYLAAGFGEVSFTMSGNARIKGCEASDPPYTDGNGGGVYVGGNDTTFTMAGGEITGCTATNGDAIYIFQSTMYANGGTVNGKIALASGAIIKRDAAETTIESYTKFLGSISGSIDDSVYPYTITLTNGKGRTETFKLLRGGTISPSILLSSDEVVLAWYYTAGETTNRVTLDTFLSDGTTERAPGSYTLTVKLAEDELDALDTALAQLQSAYDDLKKALDNQASDLTDAVATLNQAIDAVKAALDEKASTDSFNDLRKEVDEVQTKIGKIQISLSSLEATNSSQQQKIDEIIMSLGNLQTDLNTLTNRIAALETSADELQKAQTALEAALANKAGKDELQIATNNLNAAIGRLNELETNFSGAESALSGRIAELIGSAKGTLKDAEDRIALLEAEITEISQRIAALERANEQLEKELAAKGEGSAENAALEAKNAAQDAEVARLQTFLTVVCVIACVSLAGNIAIVTVAFVLKRKRMH